MDAPARSADRTTERPTEVTSLGKPLMQPPPFTLFTSCLLLFPTTSFYLARGPSTDRYPSPPSSSAPPSRFFTISKLLCVRHCTTYIYTTYTTTTSSKPLESGESTPAVSLLPIPAARGSACTSCICNTYKLTLTTVPGQRLKDGESSSRP
jgi:hypothetical protein